MNNDFDFLGSLPLIIFGVAILAVFVSLIYGGVILLRAQWQSQEKERGKEILLNSFIALIMVLVVALIFNLVTYFLRRGEALIPQQAEGDIPLSPAIGFPPAPEIIKVGDYYFRGPWPLKDNRVVEKPALFSILCKNNENYDIIDIVQAAEKQDLLRNTRFACWQEKCGQDLNNIYLSLFSIPKHEDVQIDTNNILGELGSQINPPCFVNQ